MKILYINSLDKRYGSTYRSRNIVKALISLGHDVQYIESNLAENIFQNSVSIKQKDNIFGYFATTCKRAVFVLKSDFDILYIQKFIPLTVPCLIAGKLKGRKCIVDWDDLDFCYQTNVAKKMLVFLCEHIFPYFADCITTHSNRLKKYAHKIGIKRVEIVNQVVNFDKFEMSDSEKIQLKSQIGATGKKILCFLGTLTLGGAADLDIIIKAVSQVARARNDIFFLIIGGGSLEKEIYELLKRNQMNTISYITGLVSHQEVQRFLSISDGGLIYMRNNLGNKMRVSFKILEYLAFGIPVVGHLTGESKERFSSFCSTGACKAEFAENIIEFLNSRITKKQFPLKEYSVSNMKESLNTILNSYYL